MRGRESDAEENEEAVESASSGLQKEVDAQAGGSGKAFEKV